MSLGGEARLADPDIRQHGFYAGAAIWAVMGSRFSAEVNARGRARELCLPQGKTAPAMSPEPDLSGFIRVAWQLGPGE